MSFFLHLPVTAWPRNLVPGNLYFFKYLESRLVSTIYTCKSQVQTRGITFTHCYLSIVIYW